MSPTIRPRIAAAGIAAVTGFAGLGIAAGPASAASAATSTDSVTTASQAPQSSGFPRNSLDYTDRFVIAYGVGDDSTMNDLATQEVIDALNDHGDAHAKRWHRTAADSGMGHTWVSYTNLDTGEVMTFSVRLEMASNGEPNAVREVKFND